MTYFDMLLAEHKEQNRCLKRKIVFLSILIAIETIALVCGLVYFIWKQDQQDIEYETPPIVQYYEDEMTFSEWSNKKYGKDTSE